MKEPASYLPNLNLALLHQEMHNKEGRIVTTSLTLIDVHDLARSSKTYGIKSVFIAHPSDALRRLTLTLKNHWEDGFGATYNPNRKEALEIIEVVYDLDEILEKIRSANNGVTAKLIATSAKSGPDRISFKNMRNIIESDLKQPFLLMLGTGWGMSEQLLQRADYYLEPISGPTDYNHLSVRSACSIMLDRLLSPQTKSLHL